MKIKINLENFLFLFILLVILFLILKKIKKSKLLETYENDEENINFTYSVRKLYSKKSSDNTCNIFPFPAPKNGEEFKVPGYILKFCMGHNIKTLIPYYTIKKDVEFDEKEWKCYKLDDEFGIPGYILSKLQDVSINPPISTDPPPFETNLQIIESFQNIIRFPFETVKLYRDITICNIFPFPKPEEEYEFRIPGKILQFCSTATNTMIPYYKIIAGDIYEELCYKKGSEFAIPGYKFTYTAEDMPGGPYVLDKSWVGEEFTPLTNFRSGKDWIFYKNKPDNKKCRFTNDINEQATWGDLGVGRFLNGPLPTEEDKDNDGDIVCCSEKKDGRVCFGSWYNQINVDSDNVLKIQLSKKKQEHFPRSIKLETHNNNFRTGLFVIDIKHMPVGLSVWGTIRLTRDSDNINSDEIDIIQATNIQDDKRIRETENIYRKEPTKNISSLFTSLQSGNRCMQSVTSHLIPIQPGDTPEPKYNDCAGDLFGCKTLGLDDVVSSGIPFNKEGGGIFICEVKDMGAVSCWYVPKKDNLKYKKINEAK